MTTTHTMPGPSFRATSLVGYGLRTYLMGRIGRLGRLDYWQRNSAGIQLSQLRTLIREAQHTEFGKSHDFPRLATLDNNDLLSAYRKAVPVADWYAYKDLIARMREGGEPDLLWPGRVMDFAQTSGTTAGDKFIPVSQAMLKSNFRASLDIFGYLARFGVPLGKMLAGKSLFLGGSTNLDTNAHGVRTGDLSGIVTPLIRWPLTKIYLPGSKIALMSHWPSKIEAMAQRCIDEDVRMVSGMPSWGLVLFNRVIELARERGRDAKTLRDVWPNFMALVHGGVKYTPFESRVREIWSGSAAGPDVPHRLELYPASEGFIAIQDSPGDPGLRLLTDNANFFEFVPLESINDPDPPAFSCEAVEKGQRYVVVLSTCAGLWRYILGDVVEFDTIPDKRPSVGGGGGDGPARLRIVGRHRHFINAFGENLIVEHIENAVAAAAAEAGITIGEFTAAPVYPSDSNPAGLELVLETPNSSQRAIEAFRDAFDQSLKRQNVDYTTKRTDGLGMAPPTITPVPMGAFHRWLESRGKLGGQHKCPRCANHREIVDQVRAVVGLDTPSTPSRAPAPAEPPAR